VSSASWHRHQETYTAKCAQAASQTKESEAMSVEQMVDRMVSFVPTSASRGKGVLTVTSPVNPRTGEAAHFSVLADEEKAEAIRDWLRDLLLVIGDDVAARFKLRQPGIGYLPASPAAMHPDRVLGDLLYSVPRVG